MRESKNRESAVCELLLILFSLGALLFILCRSGVLGPRLRLPWTTEEWIAGILALDAFMTGSLLCWLVMPAATLALGAVAAAAGSGILNLDQAWWRALLVLLTAVPLHFLLCGWSLGAAAEVRRLLCGRGYRRHLYSVSFLLMIGAALASAMIIYLYQRGLI